MEALDTAKDLEKDFLCSVRGIRRVVQDAIHQTVNRLVVVRDQPLVSFVRSGLQLGDDRSFLSPCCQRTCDVSQSGCSRHSFTQGAFLKISRKAGPQQLQSRALPVIPVTAKPAFAGYPALTRGKNR